MHEENLKPTIVTDPKTTKMGILVKDIEEYSDGKVWKYTYDQYGRKIKEEESPSRFCREYEYDNNGNLICKKDSYGKVIRFVYDKNGNMIKEICYVNDEFRSEFTYDKNGNIIKFLTKGGKWIEYIYDENNNLVETRDSDGRTCKISYKFLELFSVDRIV